MPYTRVEHGLWQVRMMALWPPCLWPCRRPLTFPFVSSHTGNLCFPGKAGHCSPSLHLGRVCILESTGVEGYRATPPVTSCPPHLEAHCLWLCPPHTHCLGLYSASFWGPCFLYSLATKIDSKRWAHRLFTQETLNVSSGSKQKQRGRSWAWGWAWGVLFHGTL